MRIRHFALTIFWGLVLTGLFVGCGSSDNPTLAVVGDYEIKAEEFNEYFRSVRYPFPNAQDEFAKRRELLDSVIVNRLLIEAAYEKGIDKSEDLTRAVVAQQDRLLVDVLGKRKIADQAEPSDAELRDYWEKLEFKVKASHILVDNLDTATALVSRIQAGESFEKLAFDYSKDPAAKKNKGDLGWFTWGQTVEEFEIAAWAMEPGQVSPPIKTQWGYHVIKLVDRLANEYRQEFDVMKPELRQQLRGRKQSRIAKDYIDQLKLRYVITVDSTTCAYLLHKRELVYPPMLLATLPRNDFDIEQLDRNERELVMATWENGQITVAEYLELIKGISPTIKPPLDDYDSLAAVIFQLKLRDIFVVEAHKDGLDSDPEYQRLLTMFRELAMADIMKNDSLPNPPPPDEGMARQYYDEHLDEFTNPTKVQVFEILLSDELTANKLAKEIRSLQTFKERAMDLTERPGKRASSGDLGYIDRKFYPEIYDVAVKTPVGAIGGPVVTMGKYSIFYIADKLDAEVQDFLSVKRQITQKLAADLKAQALGAWIAERKANTSINVNEDAIWKTIDREKYPESTEQPKEQG